MEEFIDERDGNRYKIVKIGNLVWFAENLKYQGVSHHFPDRNSDNIQKYGCLYTWENAMKACPEGWRLPTLTDFDELLTHITHSKSACYHSNFLSLIAKSTAWIYYSNKGVDEFGFGAMPAGYHHTSENNYNFGRSGYWWSATENNSNSPRAYRLYLSNGYATVSDDYQAYGFSVRCIKD